jgi:hypothetical protein
MTQRKPFSGNRMSPDECSIQQLVAQLRTAQFQSYLLSHGWVETSSSYTNQLRFEADMSDGEGVYELYLPASSEVARYQTHLLRSIYKLCGIEDREPADIAREMVADRPEIESPVVSAVGTRLRVHKSGSTPLRVSVDSPAREHTLYADESIEMICGRSESIEIERSDDAVVIRTTPQR